MMRKLLGYVLVLLLVPVLALGQQTGPRKLFLVPFHDETKGEAGAPEEAIAQLIGAELAKEGDVEAIARRDLAAVFSSRRVDLKRAQNILNLNRIDALLWGRITKLESGEALEVSVLDKRRPQNAYVFSATGKDRAELLSRIKEIAAQIGTSVLDRPKIGRIIIEGNSRVQNEAILNKMDLKPGAQFSRSALGKEVKEIYGMGYFDDVQISADKEGEKEVGIKITVRERPSLKKIDIEGNSVVTKDEIQDKIETKTFSVASTDKIRTDIEKIKQLYEAKGYFQPTIQHDLKEVSRNEANLVFKIDEGSKSLLTEIELDGAAADRVGPIKAFLGKALSLKEKTIIWFLDQTGSFTREKLEDGRKAITIHYLDNGFANAQVSAPSVHFDGGRTKVTYKIQENDRYQVRNTGVEGDVIPGLDELKQELKTKSKTWFKRSSIQEDVQSITKLYNNAGFAYVDVEPKTNLNPQHKFVDVIYKITQGQKVNIERVDITGNDRTRTKVIQRMIQVAEGDVYNADGLDSSKKSLEGLEFFEAVRYRTSPGSKPDQMNVTFDVMEKRTGQLAVGLGFSSQEGTTGTIDLKERNLFGMAIGANAKASLSSRRNSYEGSINYPWLFELPLAASLSVYQQAQRETHYLKDSQGFSINFQNPLYGLWRMETGFSRDSSELSRFDPRFLTSITEYYRSQGGLSPKFFNQAENAVSLAFIRDTRVGGVLRTGGTKLAVGGRWSGLGGDVSYARYFTEGLYYHPLVWKSILKVRVSSTALQEISKDVIPFNSRIHLGGPQTIRGYRPGEIGPKDKFGSNLGGDRAFFSNVEVLLPLLEAQNLNGVAFFDIGNTWNVRESPLFTEVKAGFGLGIRWLSPFGPIRIEYGWKVKREKGEDAGTWGFAMGELF